MFFVVVIFSGFLFLLMQWIGYIISLWQSLNLPYNLLDTKLLLKDWQPHFMGLSKNLLSHLLMETVYVTVANGLNNMDT